MKKNYMSPTLTVEVVELSNNYMEALSQMGKSNDSSNKITSSSAILTKDRDDDHESDGWSDGLW